MMMKFSNKKKLAEILQGDCKNMTDFCSDIHVCAPPVGFMTKHCFTKRCSLCNKNRVFNMNKIYIRLKL
uniref:Uncharacterized protein n=1 Tax=Papilio xuthus TaxID=66420 RepID=I4DJZ3_PAPXU|nr:unknown unsecreted protein [Papilio xuthus]